MGAQWRRRELNCSVGRRELDCSVGQLALGCSVGPTLGARRQRKLQQQQQQRPPPPRPPPSQPQPRLATPPPPPLRAEHHRGERDHLGAGRATRPYDQAARVHPHAGASMPAIYVRCMDAGYGRRAHDIPTLCHRRAHDTPPLSRQPTAPQPPLPAPLPAWPRPWATRVGSSGCCCG